MPSAKGGKEGARRSHRDAKGQLPDAQKGVSWSGRDKRGWPTVQGILQVKSKFARPGLYAQNISNSLNNKHYWDSRSCCLPVVTYRIFNGILKLCKIAIYVQHVWQRRLEINRYIEKFVQFVWLCRLASLGNYLRFSLCVWDGTGI